MGRAARAGARGRAARGEGRAWVVHGADNVATLVTAGARAGALLRLGGAAPPGSTIRAVTAIPYGHKVALRALARGAAIIKYGLPMGRATRPIRAGEHVHVHNVESRRGRADRAGSRRRRRAA